MTAYCIDCLAIEAEEPRLREGRSRRCLFHKAAWQRWTSNQRMRRSRGKPPPPPYEPQPVPELPDEKWLTAAEVERLDDLSSRVSRTGDTITNGLRNRRAPSPEALNEYMKAVTDLTEDLRAVLWREERLPPRRRRPATMRRWPSVERDQR